MMLDAICVAIASQIDILQLARYVTEVTLTPDHVARPK